MLHFTLTLDLGNEAMETAADVAEVLESVAAQLRDADAIDATRTIRDRNGNYVGYWVTGEGT